jgi:hypothetical protein
MIEKRQSVYYLQVRRSILIVSDRIYFHIILLTGKISREVLTINRGV